MSPDSYLKQFSSSTEKLFKKISELGEFNLGGKFTIVKTLFFSSSMDNYQIQNSNSRGNCVSRA